jgi:hypothetical protein
MFSKNSAIKNVKSKLSLFTGVYYFNFSQSLKQAKEALIKSKKIDKFYKNNKRVIDKTEENTIKKLYNLNYMFLKLGVFFIVLPGIYYFYNSLRYPIYSKKLTDSYNLVLNMTMASNCFYVKFI